MIQNRPPLRYTGLIALPWQLCAASAFGASGSAASVSRPLSVSMPGVHSPLCTYDSALCSQRVACLPYRLATVLNGLTLAGPSSLLNLQDSAASSRRSVRTALTRRRPASVRRHGPGRSRVGVSGDTDRPPSGWPVQSTQERTGVTKNHKKESGRRIKRSSLSRVAST